LRYQAQNFINTITFKKLTAEHAEYAEKLYRLIIIMTSVVSANSAVN
jgi:hypothetical protein